MTTSEAGGPEKRPTQQRTGLILGLLVMAQFAVVVDFSIV